MSNFFETEGERQADEYRRWARAQDDDDEIPEDDDEIDEDEFDENPADEVIDTLKTIERHRAALREAASYFEAILSTNPELHRQWQEFTRGGGVSSGDFCRFLDGQVVRYRPTRHCKHLRLVVNQRKPTAIRRPRGQGDDAA